LAAFLLISAAAHVLNPDFYAAMIPNFIPVTLANILATIVELIVGIALILPRYRKMGGLLFMLLMIAFLPIHIWDLFREEPAIGAAPMPMIRFIIQLLLIYAGWWIFNDKKASA
jgi:uncharacterized membrane protein